VQEHEIGLVMRDENPPRLCRREQQHIICGAWHADRPCLDHIVPGIAQQECKLAGDVVIEVKISH